jgi:uncharacterized membrane protein
MQAFPIPAPQFNGASRRVGAGSALNWLQQGWAMFIARPGAWMAMTVIVIVIYVGLATVPLIGPLAAHLLAPVLAAGMLIACQKLAHEQDLAISDLFAGFQQHTSALLTLGVLYMLAMLALAVLAMLLAGLLWLLLSVPIVMAIWFAPALVVFNAMAPVDALKASFNACLKNILVFLVYAPLVMVLCFFATLPVGLGFLVLGPVLAGSVYASYRDIFLSA